ncbi:MAG: hypothetical protein HC849_22105 [Oscillatoriales cyanobacterium RU_3_3]|nr:hypothetical protein [Microcoleus sp. SM1_3_4]NJM62283.1 hypothetical protein [Oscillatoriales cyanobacterium RU_3_3]
MGREGEWKSGRVEEWESGRGGEWESGKIPNSPLSTINYQLSTAINA